MSEMTPIELEIDFRDAARSPDVQEKQTQSLYQQMRGISGVEVERVADPNPPEGAKGATFLWGLLKAKVGWDSIKNLTGFLGDRLGNKPIKIKVILGDKPEFEIEASSRAELRAAEEAINRLRKPPE
ncbi:hypothetical protein IQ266_27800 [filamentous cyanobacterium LEGE 11480]|uniref:Uncharacterized protein n=1 Tax=Romeriopsis navalis LEGE 11480 TaxID=2777977 RepID=A0A928VUX4_9CYAN|nr:hypothetical protein [Romeriopsis navalis]MBE9033536.1 hypothetical protein [Romeriopsis navalis LEGE 11480]